MLSKALPSWSSSEVTSDKFCRNRPSSVLFWRVDHIPLLKEVPLWPFTKQPLYTYTIKSVLQRQRKEKKKIRSPSHFFIQQTVNGNFPISAVCVAQPWLLLENNSFLSDLQVLHFHCLMFLLLVCVTFPFYSGVERPLLVAFVWIFCPGIPLNQNVTVFYPSILYPGLFIHWWFSLHGA